jgi:hypothetical protein
MPHVPRFLSLTAAIVDRLTFSGKRLSGPVRSARVPNMSKVHRSGSIEVKGPSA